MGNDLPVNDFEVRLYKADGKLSIVMAIVGMGPQDAKSQAARMLKDEITYAIIWQGLTEIATVHRDKPT